jgi:hypothetical protein
MRSSRPPIAANSSAVISKGPLNGTLHTGQVNMASMYWGRQNSMVASGQWLVVSG